MKVIDWVHVLFVGGGDYWTKENAGNKTYGITVEDPNWTPMHPTQKRFNINHNTLLSLPNDGMWLRPEDLDRVVSELAAVGVTRQA